MLGEIGAAYAAGLISSRDAIVTAYLRGKAASLNKSDGLMLAVGLGFDAAEKHLRSIHSNVAIACLNSPESITLSGFASDIMAAKRLFDQLKVFAKVLSTGGNAYHSSHMLPLGQLYQEDILDNCTTEADSRRLPKIPMFSSVSGLRLGQDDVNSQYWKQNLESPVLFQQAIESLVETSDVQALIEIGPHSALRSSLRQIAKSKADGEFPQYFSSLVRGKDCVSALLNTAGLLWAHGYSIHTEQANSTESHRDDSIGGLRLNRWMTMANLPRYQWQYEKPSLLENRWTREWRLRRHPRHDILGSRLPGNDQKCPTWRNVLRYRDVEWLGDHRVGAFSWYLVDYPNRLIS